MAYTCPRGHQSADADYCSECGARIQAPALQAAAPIPPASGPMATGGANHDVCPDCATPRLAGTRFCEVCRYDFLNRASFSGLGVTPAAAPAVEPPPLPPVELRFDPPPVPQQPLPSTQAPESVVPPVIAYPRLQLRIMVDPALDTDPDPASPCPVGQADRIFHIDLDENTLGRQYEGHGVHPEIVVNDPGISRRHIKFLRSADGKVTALELGSANGTTFNGKVLEPGVVTAVQAGDEIILGMWTRIRLEAR